MLKNLKNLRLSRKITQQQLGNMIGVSQQSINKYENHNIEPDIKTLMLIADVFETSVDYIIGYTNINHRIEEVKNEQLSEREHKLIETFRRLSPSQKRIVEEITQSYFN